MKFQYASDLHLEFGANSRYMQSHPLEPKGDVLLLAGDIIYLENRRMELDPFFDWCSEHYGETLIVPGNHEYYMDPVAREGHREGLPLDSTLDGYEYRVRDNVRYLNNRSAVFGDTEVFCTTLWSITDSSFYTGIQNGMNDCRLITYHNRKLWADDFLDVHAVCREWLDSALKASSAKHRIVLTHHCPSVRYEFDTRHPGSGLYSAFHVDMEPFIAEHEIDCWIYGHTHTQDGSGTAVPSGGGKEAPLVCNQLGYVAYGENSGFRTDCVIEI